MSTDIEKRQCEQAANQPEGRRENHLEAHLEEQREEQREAQREAQLGDHLSAGQAKDGCRKNGRACRAARAGRSSSRGWVHVSPELCAKGARSRRLPRDAQAGFTLVEVLGALVVGSIVFAFAAFGISGGLESARVSGFNESLELLRMNVQEVYASSRGFGSSNTSEVDITETLVEAGAIPRNWLTDDGANIVHNFGGGVQVNGNVSYFTITASDITESACRKIVSSQYGNWDLIELNGTEVTSVPVLTCDEDGNGSVGNNTLSFQTR